MNLPIKINVIRMEIFDLLGETEVEISELLPNSVPIRVFLQKLNFEDNQHQEEIKALMKNRINESDLQKITELVKDHKLYLTYLDQDFKRIFPRHKETISLKYISQHLKVSVDALIVWFFYESVPITKRRHGKFVNKEELKKFMIRISEKYWEIEDEPVENLLEEII